ncbi:MAG: hypothetical protein JWR08_1688 [Enterovirga sp.]|nr:hypothetical protein [Enterovirga sp.]
MPQPLTLLGLSALALLAGVVAEPAAHAQTAPAQTAPGNPVQPQPRDPNMPSSQNTVPEKMDSTGSTGTLSEKLGASGGVITPPAGIDSGITARPPVPNPGTTPVIPPSGLAAQPPQTK